MLGGADRSVWLECSVQGGEWYKMRPEEGLSHLSFVSQSKRFLVIKESYWRAQSKGVPFDKDHCDCCVGSGFWILRIRSWGNWVTKMKPRRPL